MSDDGRARPRRQGCERRRRSDDLAVVVACFSHRSRGTRIAGVPRGHLPQGVAHRPRCRSRELEQTDSQHHDSTLPTYAYGGEVFHQRELRDPDHGI